MSSPDERALVLIGPMGSGKSSVGRRAARELGVSFADTDAVLARRHGPVPSLFETLGESGFRRLERQAVAEALAEGGVVALGGGAVLDVQTRADLARHRVVLLTVAPHIVAARLRGSGRPLLSGDDPVGRWERIYAERRDVYEQLADATFDTSSGPLEAVVSRVVEWAQAVPSGCGAR